ncbi:hypothetical protein [Allomesorhizobium camelthorni]|uniref:Uncharacterized protein n=1 Tax=Allomesorhizobium camelthorni TaxID=475069 RepID=A0A6G4WH89_9HYPH|nr:hypothetical protein [Mesorhizobium camelthorni]NGO53586.1 hypothetical protein [Mesorhizobium camelthorni]
MGSIVSFVQKKAGASRPGQAAGAPATVIIFPGVRYERREAQSAVSRPGLSLPKQTKPQH